MATLVGMIRMVPVLRRFLKRPGLDIASQNMLLSRMTTSSEHKIVLQNQSLPIELEARANERFDELAQKHRDVPTDPEVRRKRLIYRSKQRGWLEVSHGI